MKDPAKTQGEHGGDLARSRAEMNLQTEQRASELARLPEENPNPVLRISTDGTILYANKAGADLLDFWKCQVGRPAPAPLRDGVLEVARFGSSRESEVLCRDRVFSFFFVPVADRGYVNLYGLDVTARKKAETQLEKLNRILQAQARSSQAMMRATKEPDYLQEVCKIVIEDCGHAMVWIGYAEEDAGRTVRPVAHSGFEEGYLEKLATGHPLKRRLQHASDVS